jgi:hypothetical protein
MLYPATLQEKAEENQMQCKLELGPSIAQGIAYIPCLLGCHPMYRFPGKLLATPRWWSMKWRK